MTILLEDEDTLVFSPNFAKVQAEILRMVDSIVNAVKLFPRIEAQVYVDLGASNIFLKVYYPVFKMFAFTKYAYE